MWGITQLTRGGFSICMEMFLNGLMISTQHLIQLLIPLLILQGHPPGRFEFIEAETGQEVLLMFVPQNESAVHRIPDILVLAFE